MDHTLPSNGILTHSSYAAAIRRGTISAWEWRWAPIGRVHLSVWRTYWAARWPQADRTCPTCERTIPSDARRTYCQPLCRPSLARSYRSYAMGNI